FSYSPNSLIRISEIFLGANLTAANPRPHNCRAASSGSCLRVHNKMRVASDRDECLGSITAIRQPATAYPTCLELRCCYQQLRTDTRQDATPRIHASSKIYPENWISISGKWNPLADISLMFTLRQPCYVAE